MGVRVPWLDLSPVVDEPVGLNLNQHRTRLIEKPNPRHRRLVHELESHLRCTQRSRLETLEHCLQGRTLLESRKSASKLSPQQPDVADPKSYSLKLYRQHNLRDRRILEIRKMGRPRSSGHQTILIGCVFSLIVLQSRVSVNRFLLKPYSHTIGWPTGDSFGGVEL